MGTPVAAGDSPSPAEPSPTSPSLSPPSVPAVSEPTSYDEMLEKADTTGTPPGPVFDGELPPPSAAPGQARPLPNYDGRPPRPRDAAEVLIWVPRVIFYPVHLTFEYLLRRPIVATVRVAEEYHLVDRLREWTTWDDGRAQVVPRFLIDVGFRPHVGLSLYWGELGSDDTIDLRSSVTAWSDLVDARASLQVRILRDDSAIFSVHGQYLMRPDNVYLGRNETDPCFAVNGCRFWSSNANGMVALQAFFGELDRFTARLSYASVDFSRETDFSPRIPPRIAADLPGFQDGYDIMRLQLNGEVDTRSADIENHRSSGVRTDLRGMLAFNPFNPALRYARYGAEVAGFLDLGWRHVLSARIYVDFIENLGERRPGSNVREPIPFTELIELGGPEYMRGFLFGRLRGRRAYESTIQYRWPVLFLLDASVFVSVGGVTPSFLEWNINESYLNYGLAFRTVMSPVLSLDLLMALGSNRFDSPDFNPAHVGRLAASLNYGF